MEFVAICKLEDIPSLGARVVQRKDGVDIAVFRNAEDRVFALRDKCPHKGGPLSQGIVFRDRVACPLHNWSIALDTGCALPPDQGCAQGFPVKVEDGVVYLAPYSELVNKPTARPDCGVAHSLTPHLST